MFVTPIFWKKISRLGSLWEWEGYKNLYYEVKKSTEWLAIYLEECAHEDGPLTSICYFLCNLAFGIM